MDLSITHADYQPPCFTSISYVHFVRARPSFNFFSRLKDGTCGSQPPRWRPLPLSSGRPGPASPPLTHAWRLCASDGVWPESTLHVRLGFRLPLSWTGCCRGSHVVRRLKQLWEEVQEGRAVAPHQPAPMCRPCEWATDAGPRPQSSPQMTALLPEISTANPR